MADVNYQEVHTSGGIRVGKSSAIVLLMMWMGVLTLLVVHFRLCWCILTLDSDSVKF